MFQLFFTTISIFFIFITNQYPSEGYIIGGEETTIDAIPYIVSVQSYDVNQHYCGGSIIGDKWILSAAHCTQEKGRKYYVRIGSTYNARGGYIYNVSRVLVHPKWNYITVDSDIALMELDRPIKFDRKSKKISICNRVIPSASVVRISGWGLTQEDNTEPSPVLRTTEIITVSTERCQKNYPDMKITDSMLCAEIPGGHGACRMDSGGPLVYNENELLGIVSWGEGCGGDKPGVYTNVTQFRDWIKKNTGI